MCSIITAQWKNTLHFSRSTFLSVHQKDFSIHVGAFCSALFTFKKSKDLCSWNQTLRLFHSEAIKAWHGALLNSQTVLISEDLLKFIYKKKKTCQTSVWPFASWAFVVHFYACPFLSVRLKSNWLIIKTTNNSANNELLMRFIRGGGGAVRSNCWEERRIVWPTYTALQRAAGMDGFNILISTAGFVRVNIEKTRWKTIRLWNVWIYFSVENISKAIFLLEDDHHFVQI